jgi:hypothetical protein
MTITSNLTYEPCGTCGAPLGDNQRYCVVCGTNRRHPEDPVARYLVAARRRTATPAAPVIVDARGDHKWTAVALALLPLAAGLGVLLGGGGGSSTADEKLLAALRDRPAAVAGGTAVAATTALSSDFGLDKGFTIRVGTLPWETTTRASADKAIAAAEKDGAKHVGLINPDDYTLTPDTGGDYLLYAGEYKTRADAAKALEKLEKDLPDAAVVKVGASASSGGGTSAAGSALDSAGDEAVAEQQHPTERQKADGAEIVRAIQANKGKSYVEQQRKLPDTIVIP